MRNIYDQYSQPENRLTHALICTLYEEPGILKQFIKWVTGAHPTNNKLKLLEQRLPGEEEVTEDDLEDRGLPDGWIHDDQEWSLLIESKALSSLNTGQLERHYKTASKRGFTSIQVLAITVAPPCSFLPDYVICKCWHEIYSWMSSHTKSSRWAELFIRYLETAESKLSASGYLQEGTLTKFNGIRFDEDTPYSYLEAKRLLKLIMAELRTNRKLLEQLGVEPTAAGRGAITGRNNNSVWDLLRLNAFDSAERHTHHPHLTFAIGRERVSAMLTLPNNMHGVLRRNIISLGEEGFFSVIEHVNRNLAPVMRKAPGAIPLLIVSQQHFPSRRAKAHIDGRLEIDLRTAFPENSNIKYQPEWLAAVYPLLYNKNSNMEWQIGVIYPLEHCQTQLQDPNIIDLIAESWIATQPLLDIILE